MDDVLIRKVVRELFPVFIEELKSEGLIIVPESYVAKNLQQKYLRKKSLTFKEIADANLWGDIGKSRVEAIAKEELIPHEKFKDGNKWKVHRSAVERIGKNRGII